MTSNQKFDAAKAAITRCLEAWFSDAQEVRAGTQELLTALEDVHLFGRSPAEKAKHREYMRRYMQIRRLPD